jgi:hypothetical protein
LPIERERATGDDLRTIQQDLRGSIHHPERYLDESEASVADWIALKRRWIDTPQVAENARQRCLAIREANRAMQPWVEPKRNELTERLTQTKRRLQAASVLASREYAYCLHPETNLRDFLSGLASQAIK